MATPPRMILITALSILTTLAAAELGAQSVRRKSVNTIAPSPSMRQYLESLPKEDIDLYFGRVIGVGDGVAYVLVSSPTKMRGRIPVYYACDMAMRPTAILSDMRLAHKNCAAFKIENGSVEKGDSVMVKHMVGE